jgi:hypothetical protein
LTFAGATCSARGKPAHLANQRAAVLQTRQRMSDQAHTSCLTLAGLGWSDYARYYAWRFS